MGGRTRFETEASGNVLKHKGGVPRSSYTKGFTATLKTSCGVPTERQKIAFESALAGFIFDFMTWQSNPQNMQVESACHELASADAYRVSHRP